MTAHRAPEFFKGPGLRVGVVGCGYVGLPLALRLAERGHRVVGFDTDARKVDILNSGGTYIKHIPPERIAPYVETGGFSATGDFARVRELDAVLICVPTPLDERRDPDLTYVASTARAIAPHLQRGQLVVLESTTYPGTTDELVLPILESSGLHCPIARPGSGEDEATDFFLAFSPEREDPGNARFNLAEIPKVVGGQRPSGLEAAALYAANALTRVVPVSSTRVAEMAKLLENIFRCVNIALVNELKMLCDRMDMDVWEVDPGGVHQALRLHALLPGPRAGRALHPHRPVLPDVEGARVRVPDQVHRAGRRGEHADAVLRGAAPMEALNGTRRASTARGPGPGRGVQEGRRNPIFESRPPSRSCSSWGSAGCTSNTRPVLPSSPSYAPLRLLPSTLGGAGTRSGGRVWLVVIVTDHSSYDYEALVADARLVVDTRNATRQVRHHRNKIILA